MMTKRHIARQNHVRRGYAFLAGASAAALLAFFPASAHAQLSVERGWDLFTTVTGTSFDFGGGPIPLVGVPLGSFDFTTGTGGDFGRGIGVQATGNTDTIVKRLAVASVPSVPNTAPPIDIEMVALHLMTAVPIDMGFGLHNYFVTLQSERIGGGTPSTGTMTITFNNTNSPPPTQPVNGTFDSSWQLHLDIREDSTSGVIRSSPDLTLSSSGANWSHFPDPNQLLINGVNNDLNGNDHLADFFPIGTIGEEHPGQGVHLVIAAVSPEPGALAFVALGLLAGVVRRRRG